MTDVEKFLLMDKKSGWLKFPDEKANAYAFCEGYKEFLNTARTEREFTTKAEETAIENGFTPISEMSTLKAGDKVYKVNRGKSIVLYVIGSEDIEKGVNIVGAHLDSPRLDLKQNPLYEQDGFAYFKTHYYGGIKKYHWPAMPLALHGTVILKDGKKIEIAIGDEGDDIAFVITDLLIHASKEQMKKTLGEGVDPESLNLLIGNIPVDDENVKEPVKMMVMQYLNHEYGIIEEDFVSAELEVIPAAFVKDVGFDRSMVGGPGQDDKVCAYTALKAIFETDAPKKTAVCLLVDKEEVGSMGNTGMSSRFFEHSLSEVISLLKPNYSELMLKRCLSSSKCLSADVNVAYDPEFAYISDKRNAAVFAGGITLTKYTGSGGKSGSSDASAELVYQIRKLFNENGVLWQTGELGKADIGGGGTIAFILANMDIDVIDCGVSLLSMHSPYELASKLDIYMTYKAYNVFFNKLF